MADVGRFLEREHLNLFALVTVKLPKCKETWTPSLETALSSAQVVPMGRGVKYV